jgi:hypothetical protein
MTARCADGREVTVERPISPGHPALGVSFAEAEDKFRSCAAGAIDEPGQTEIVEEIRNIVNATSIHPLMRRLSVTA